MRILLFLLAAMLMVAGCEDNNTKESQKSGSFFSEKQPYGGILNVGTLSDFTGFAPYVSKGASSQKSIDLIYSKLFKVSETGEIIGDLVESWRYDNTALLFKLKKGIVWHDGEPLLLEDIQTTFDEAGKAKILNASPYSISLDNGTIAVVAADNQTISLETLTDVIVLPARHVKGRSLNYSNLLHSPVGTGPFRFVDFKDNTVSLQYFEPHVDGRPLLDEIRLTVFETKAALIDAMKKGTVELISGVDIDEKQVQLGQQFSSLYLETDEKQLILFNSKSKIFNQSAVRKQFSTVLEAALDPAVAVFPLYGRLNPLFYSTEASNCNVAASTKPVKGKKVRLLVAADKGYLKSIAQEVKKEWEKLGVNVDVITRSPSEVLYYMKKGLKSDAVLIHWKNFSRGHFDAFLKSQQRLISLYETSRDSVAQSICGYHVIPVSYKKNQVIYNNLLQDVRQTESGQLTDVTNWYFSSEK